MATILLVLLWPAGIAAAFAVSAGEAHARVSG
jgi:hypothetical protein